MKAEWAMHFLLEFRHTLIHGTTYLIKYETGIFPLPLPKMCFSSLCILSATSLVFKVSEGVIKRVLSIPLDWYSLQNN